MTTLRLAAATLAAVLASGAGAPAQDDGWVSLFDGKTLNGWKASDAPGTFSVKDGRIVVHGPRSHLFYDGPVEVLAALLGYSLEELALDEPGGPAK